MAKIKREYSMKTSICIINRNVRVESTVVVPYVVPYIKHIKSNWENLPHGCNSFSVRTQSYVRVPEKLYASMRIK